MSAPAPLPPAGAPPEPAPAPDEPLMEFFCYQCLETISLPAAAALRSLRQNTCPLCRRTYLELGPNPFPEEEPVTLPDGLDTVQPLPPPPPGFLYGSDEDSDAPDDFDDFDEDDEEYGMNQAEARAYLSRLIHERLYDMPPVATAAAAAVSALPDQGGDGGGVPPASAACIAALPTVEVAKPAAVCAICTDDLPLASSARRLPCAHLYHSPCVVPWLERHNSCPICRSRIPDPEPTEATLVEEDPQTTQITIRFTTTPRQRVRVTNDVMFAAAPVSASPTQLAQAVTGEGGAGPANSGETVSSDWPPQPDTDTVMSEARDGEGFFD